MTERLERQLQAAIESLHTSDEASDEAKEKIEEFLTDLLLKGIGVSRRLAVAKHMKYWAEVLGGVSLNPSREDIKAALRHLETVRATKHIMGERHEPLDRGLSETTKQGRKATLKQFYKWHLGNNEEYPPCVSWVKTSNGKGNDRAKLPEEHLTQEELERMIRAAPSMRDKCLLHLLYDIGGRIGELLALRTKDVHFDDVGAYVIIPDRPGMTKTGGRRVRLFESIPRLRMWLESHPLVDNREAPLFVTKKFTGKGGKWTGDWKGMDYVNAWKIISRIAKRADIEKRVHSHLFRHTRSTELAARGMSQAALEDRQGWVHGSKMAQIYINLAGVQQDEAFFGAMGIELSEVTKEKAIQCVRCQENNVPTAVYCARCGMGLTPEAVQEAEQKALLANKELITKDIEKLVAEQVKALVNAMQARGEVDFTIVQFHERQEGETEEEFEARARAEMEERVRKDQKKVA